MNKPKLNYPETANHKTGGEGPPVVLLHGMAASLHNWDFLAPKLVDTGFSAYSLDLLGHGKSDKPAEKSRYSIQNYYHHFENWLSSLGLPAPIRLVGHSMGCYLCLNYALHHPEKVEKMALISPFYTPYQLSPELQRATQIPGASSRVLEFTPFWLLRPFVRFNNNIASGLTAKMIDQMALDYKRAHPNILYTTPTIEDLTPQLPQIDIPTLVIWGAEDRTLSPQRIQKLVDSMPQAAGVAIEKAGHTPHLTKHRKVNRLVTEYLVK